MPDAAVTPDAPFLPDGAPAAFGSISGSCGQLAAQLASPAPSVFQADFFLPRAFAAADEPLVDPDTLTVLDTPNEGGSSEYSEAFLFEALSRCEMADLFATEAEVQYDPAGSKTDIVVTIAGERVGVSVARAMSFPLDQPYDVDAATTLLTDKLSGILESTANVTDEFSWEKQILGIMAVSEAHAGSLHTALASIDDGVKADTIVWIVVTSGEDEFIYCNGPCQ